MYQMIKKLILISSITTFAWPNSSFAKETLSWAFDPWPPFHEINKESKKPEGLLIELVQEIFEKELNYKIVYNELPWKRCQYNVEKGINDFMVTVPTKIRLAYSSASPKPLIALKDNILVTYAGHPMLKNISQIKGVEDLIKKNYRGVTYIGNGWWGENLEGKGVKTTFVKSHENVMKFLAKKQADFTAYSVSETDTYVKKYNLEGKIVKTDVLVGSLNLHFMLSNLVKKKNPKKYEKLHEEYDKIFAKLEASGKIKEILKKYDR